MATVGEISGPYANYLLPVLPSSVSVCDTCHTNVTGGWSRCNQCNQAIRQLSEVADAVAPIALAVKGEQFAHELWAYKNSPRDAVRQRFQLGLAAVTWRWLANHEACIARAAGAARFTVVTSVPSARLRDGGHPLQHMLAIQIGATRERYENLLSPAPGVEQTREHDDRRYRTSRRLDGEDVLLVDDTWTTGAHAQSAASTLKLGGASTVGIMVIGRHFNRNPSEAYRESAEAYYRQARETRWSWEVCCLEPPHAR
jgi:predicted amidophosphoribosyltransferase